MPKNTVKVNLKIKTRWGKYTLNKTMLIRMESYHPWDRADRCVKINASRHRLSKEKEFIGIDSTNSSSETEIPHGKGLRYAPNYFVNPEFAATVPCTESEGIEAEIVHHFIGKCYKNVQI